MQYNYVLNQILLGIRADNHMGHKKIKNRKSDFKKAMHGDKMCL